MLNYFFGRMVDKCVVDKEQALSFLLVESNGFWNENIMCSISGCLEKQGYENILEKASDSHWNSDKKLL